MGLAGGLNLYAYAPNPLSWSDPLGLLKCGLSGNEVGDASNLPVIKPGSKEWKQAIESIKNGKNTNFRTATEKDAIDLVNKGRGRMEQKDSIDDPYNNMGEGYKKGYELHLNVSHTNNAPENNLPHVKWKDWESGRSSGGKGHVFF
ncbi:RHS repeat-associated core domain-containing protein [Citrobacter sedlakii]|uniref:hypothetical protein n=1 Tax=Citrobacter sedlakii TaxID=67826 RepID=UPI001F172030|nr:hypothetical protein [Citrobacter sedlakii]